MEQAKIQVLDRGILAAIPEQYKDGAGRVFLDGCGKAKLTKNVNIAIGENETKEDAAVIARVAMSPLNRLVLGYSPCRELDVRLHYAGFQMDRTISVNEIDLGSSTYGLKWNTSTILEAAKQTRICDVFGDEFIVYDTATVNALTSNQDYDGASGLLDALSLPFVFYGDFENPRRDANDDPLPVNVLREDLRLLVHPLYIFQRFVSSLGYSVEAPIYGTFFGKRNFRYLLGEDYVRYLNGLGKTLVSNNITPPTSNRVRLRWDTVVYSNSLAIGVFPPVSPQIATYSWGSGAKITKAAVIIEGSITSNIPLGESLYLSLSDNAGPVPTLTVIKILDGAGTLTAYDISGRYDIPLTTYPIAFELNIVGTYSSITITQNAGMTMEVLGDTEKNYLPNETIPLKDTFTCDATVYDLIEAEGHLFNFLVDVDDNLKTLRLLNAYDANVYGEELDGALGRIYEAEMLEGESCEKDKLSCGENALLNKQYTFRFKGTSDSRVETLRENGTYPAPVFGRIEEFDTTNNKTKNYENKLYSPTTVAEYPTNHDLFGTGAVSAYTAYMTSLLLTETYDQGFRAVILYKGSQQPTGAADGKVQFEGTEIDEPLVAWQLLTTDMVVTGGRYNLVFTPSQSNNLYDIFYSAYFENIEGSSKLSHKRTMTALQFAALDQLSLFRVTFAGMEKVVRLEKATHSEGVAEFDFIVVS